ncbi:hypothetical protein [Rappaport israeli]|nr:hypothetical protein [Rappaport israeli]
MNNVFLTLDAKMASGFMLDLAEGEAVFWWVVRLEMRCWGLS